MQWLKKFNNQFLKSTFYQNSIGIYLQLKKHSGYAFLVNSEIHSACGMECDYGKVGAKDTDAATPAGNFLDFVFEGELCKQQTNKFQNSASGAKHAD